MKEQSKLFLLNLARSSIAQCIGVEFGANCFGYGAKEDTEELYEIKGTFVTLTMNSNLRGCIGQIFPEASIMDTIKQNAVSAAFNDPRFPSLTADEFNKIDIEISILSTPEKLEYTNTKELLDNIKQDEYGIIISKGVKSATFLPQVWQDLPSKEEFLSHLCFKAGLDNDEWAKSTLDVYFYTVEHFCEDTCGLSV